MRWLAPVLWLVATGAALAAPPQTSLRPELRAAPNIAEAAPAIRPGAGRAEAGNAPTASLRPRLRAEQGETSAAARPAASPPQSPAVRITRGGRDALEDRMPGQRPGTGDAAPAASSRPALRGPGWQDRAGSAQAALPPAICGIPGIEGSVLGRVPGRIKGCGIDEAVEITAVSGIGLSQAAVMDCRTAQALSTWVSDAAIPALRRQGGGLTQLRVASHYSCRTRNNRPGARISEHGRGRAIDISGFRLADGSILSVEHGWTGRRTSKVMRDLHVSACGPFGTVLGPNSDRHHRDHFHFDTARYRSGPYCK